MATVTNDDLSGARGTVASVAAGLVLWAAIVAVILWICT